MSDADRPAAGEGARARQRADERPRRRDGDRPELPAARPRRRRRLRRRRHDLGGRVRPGRLGRAARHPARAARPTCSRIELGIPSSLRCAPRRCCTTASRAPCAWRTPTAAPSSSGRASGLDARIMGNMSLAWKRRLGRAGILPTAASQFLRYEFPRLEVEIDGVAHEATFAVACARAPLRRQVGHRARRATRSAAVRRAPLRRAQPLRGSPSSSSRWRLGRAGHLDDGLARIVRGREVDDPLARGVPRSRSRSTATASSRRRSPAAWARTRCASSCRRRTLRAVPALATSSCPTGPPSRRPRARAGRRRTGIRSRPSSRGPCPRSARRCSTTSGRRPSCPPGM